MSNMSKLDVYVGPRPSPHGLFDAANWEHELIEGPDGETYYVARPRR